MSDNAFYMYLIYAVVQAAVFMTCNASRRPFESPMHEVIAFVLTVVTAPVLTICCLADWCVDFTTWLTARQTKG